MGGRTVLHALSTCEDHMVGCNDAIQLKSAELVAHANHIFYKPRDIYSKSALFRGVVVYRVVEQEQTQC